MAKVIGIDLGTTNSCVAVLKSGSSNQVDIIPNSNGAKTTPSIVAFLKNKEDEKEEIIVGDSAKRQAVTNSGNTVYGSKRLIGRRFEDQEVAKMKSHCAYKIAKASNGDAWIDVNGRLRSPSEVGAQVLIYLKKAAEAFLGEQVKDAVITVPAYFNDSQRQATKDAGKIAGLNVLRIINEPTAAALAYGLDKGDHKSRTVCIYDLGGGTFDVSILEIDNGVFEVKATNGDTFLGGEDFDERIQKFLQDEFKSSSGVDVSKDPMALQRLKEAAEKAKIELSNMTETEINLPYLSANASGPQHLQIKINRAKLNSLVEDLVQKTIVPCKSALKDANISIDQIDDVVLVGGMTRMPRVIEVVKEFFKKDPNRSVNPDEVVAAGAAIQGGVLKGDVKDIVLLDVTPLSLGLETMGGIMTKILERNTTIPCQKSQVFSTAEDGQSSVTIRIFQGERPMASDNRLMGEFTLTGIPPAPRGVPKVEVVFDMNADGILHVSASDKATGSKKDIKITSSGGLSKEEIENMVQEAEKNSDLDKKRCELAETRNNADAAISSADKVLHDAKDKISSSDKEKIEDSKKALEGVKSSELIEEIKEKTEALKDLMMKIGESLYSSSDSSSTSGNSSESDKSGNKDEDVVDSTAKE